MKQAGYRVTPNKDEFAEDAVKEATIALVEREEIEAYAGPGKD